MTTAIVAATSLHHDTFHSRDFEDIHNVQDTELEKSEINHSGLTINVETLGEIEFSGSITILGSDQNIANNVILVDSIPLSLEVSPERVGVTDNSMSVPVVLSAANVILGLASLFFFSQFVLAFFSATWLNGSFSLVAGVGSFGLFRVFSRAANVIKRKQYGQHAEISR